MWRGIERTWYIQWLISNQFRKEPLVNGVQVWREVKERIKGGENSLNSIMRGNCYDIFIMWRRVSGEIRRLM